MDRRSALKNASLLLGYTLSAPAIIGIMNGCKPEVVPGFEPAFFAKEQLGTVKAFIDGIIPKTDTPSASEVGVLEFIDNMMATVMEPKEQEMARKGFENLASLAGATAFEDQQPAEQAVILSKIEKTASEAEGDRKDQFWYALKGLTVNGYMLSEKIGTEFLAYDPIPGQYDGCADLSISGGKNWSLR